MKNITQEVYQRENKYPSESLAQYSMADALFAIANEMKRANDLKCAELFDDGPDERYLRYCALQNVKSGEV